MNMNLVGGSSGATHKKTCCMHVASMQSVAHVVKDLVCLAGMDFEL